MNAPLHQFLSQIYQTMFTKINVVGIHVEHIIHVQTLLNTLQHQCSLAHTPRPANAYHAVIPRYLIVKITEKLTFVSRNSFL